MEKSPFKIRENTVYGYQTDLEFSMLFNCPICSAPLAQNAAGAAVCERGHSFDRSREGYYNLLQKGGRIHGDNKEMVLARRDFLATGAYFPLADRISRIIEERVFLGARILDAGCGEGYYTDVIERRVRGVGFDISKDAVKLAAKKNKNLTLAVAGSYHIPAPDASCDVVLSVFAPLAREEFLRVLRTGGYFVMVIPAEEHLFELKCAIYDTPYKNTVLDSALLGFSLEKYERVSFNIPLDSREKISSLFMMTPYAYRTKPEARERVFALERLDVSAEFIIFVYKKN